MRSVLLVSRIKRILLTGAGSGDGASLADEYAQAVGMTNARLEEVVAAADARSISDAIRLLSEDPPVLEEAGMLDFLERQDWEQLCKTRGWRNPGSIDRQLVERALELGESQRAIEPLLAMYKKAVRTNNARMAVKSLRRLADLDRAQGWDRNLRQSEKQLQMELSAEFRRALDGGQTEICDRLAQEMLDGAWMESPSGGMIAEIRNWREHREAERRNVEGCENVEILKQGMVEGWNLKRAASLVREIDALVAQGWRIPDADAAAVEECRSRCAREFEQEAKSSRWREVNERLFEAVQREDCQAIRAALAVPEFLDRNPEEGLLTRAEDILDHADATKRRRTMSIAVSVVVVILSVLGLSGWWLKQKLFAERREAAVAELANCERNAEKSTRSAIINISTLLKRLKADDPAVYADSRVVRYEAVLKELEKRHGKLTNRLETALLELERMKNASWKGIEESAVLDCLRNAETLLGQVGETKDQNRFIEAKLSWQDYSQTRKEELRNCAEQSCREIAGKLQNATKSLATRLVKNDELAAFEIALGGLKDWRNKYAKDFAELDGRLSEAEKAWHEARENQRDYRQAIEAAVAAKDAVSAITAIMELKRKHSGFRETECLKMPEVDKSVVQSILDRPIGAVEGWINAYGKDVSQEEFAAFLENQKRFATYYNPVDGWESPYRKVMLLAMYMQWLKEDLKMMPADRTLGAWYDRLKDKATEIRVDGVIDSLAWICVWDERIRRRNVECAELLNRMPLDWVERYKRQKEAMNGFRTIAKWRIAHAGKIKFDPFAGGFENNPQRISLETHARKDHPLYVLRKRGDNPVLMPAFRPTGDGRWGKIAEMERDGGGYALGEPLYHVHNGERFIDVDSELKKISAAANGLVGMSSLESIPVFGNGVQ